MSDGGVAADPEKGCLQWCSRVGYCGTSLTYRRGVDCRPQKQQQRQRILQQPQFDASFVAAFGEEQWESHRRQRDHAETYGRIISVRGERHCGTGWVRMMILGNCPEIRHRWTKHLDSDGLYGWKHGFVPEHFDSRSKDAIVLVFRSAVSWIPKMLKTSYSDPITKVARSSRGSLADFVAKPFVERGVSYDNVVDLRTKKYRQYFDTLASHPNLVGARYEDLLLEPTFLFRHLSHDLQFPCTHDETDFHYVKGYAKFGTTAASKSIQNLNRTWTRTEWGAVVTRLDHGLESAKLGYAYDLSVPGRWYHLELPSTSLVLRIS